MGVVHLARKADGKRVALKVLRPHIVGDDEARARLAREVASLERIRSRWIAEIVDADPWGPTPYVATRYVPGLSLHDHVPEEGPILGDDLRWFAGGLAEGVASVHAVGVLHRDVKPSNVLMEGRAPILIDFGLARVADDPRLTHTGWFLGTPGYLAPEILHGEDATTMSDVHSWAATVAFAGTGRPPFGRGPSMAIMDRVRRGEHDLTGLPDDLLPLVAAALDPDPARRPTLDEIRARLAGPTVQVTSQPPAPVEDPYTLPLAIVAHDRAAALTLRPEPVPAPAPADPGSLPPTRWLTEPYDAPVPELPWAEEPTAAERPLVRARRGALLLALGLLVATAVAAWPYLAITTTLVVTWLLCAATRTASAHHGRTSLRGSRWYDVLVAPLSTPWHLVAAVPGALLLSLWSLGLALAGTLLCYAFGLAHSTTLFVAGLCLAAGVWLGPGSVRVRWPLLLVARPLARRTTPWLVGLLLLLAAAALAALLAGDHTGWAPLGAPPWLRG